MKKSFKLTTQKLLLYGKYYLLDNNCSAARLLRDPGSPLCTAVGLPVLDSAYKGVGKVCVHVVANMICPDLDDSAHALVEYLCNIDGCFFVAYALDSYRFFGKSKAYS